MIRVGKENPIPQQAKSAAALVAAGAIAAHSMAPSVANALGKAQCEVRLYFAGIATIKGCEGGAPPPKASIPISIASSTSSMGGTMTTAMAARIDAITGVEHPAGMYVEFWGHPLAAQPSLLRTGSTFTGGPDRDKIIFIVPST
jgi:hypothetical protein